MRVVRALATGAFMVGAASVAVGMGAGVAGAAAVTPLPGGVQVDLSPADTRWVHDSGVGRTLAGLPHPSAASFGYSLDSAAALSSRYPNGRVIFTVVGPVERLGGTMLALKQ